MERKHLFTKLTRLSVVSFILALLMALTEPMQIFAASEEDAYISEIYIITGEQKDRAVADGYIVVDSPLYVNNLDKGNGASSTYLAYKTTNKANEAITDIRLMNMNGGWSFAEYENYFEQMRNNAKVEVASIWNAILEFRENYKNDPTAENVAYAYHVLNLVYDDDVKGTDGKPMRLGDLLLDSKKIDSAESEILLTLFLESNINVTNMIYSALAVACIRYDDGTSFLDALKEDGESYIEMFADAFALDEYVNKFYVSFDEVREALQYYSGCGYHYEDFESEEEVAEYLNGLATSDPSGTDINNWMDGYQLTKILSDVPYCGFDGSLETLYDLFMIDDEYLAEDEYMYAMLRPIVGVMSDGLRCMAMAGMTRILQFATMEKGKFTEMYQTLQNDPENADYFRDGISAFYNVDRELYQEHAVAMTNEALRNNANGDTSWAKMAKENDEANVKKDQFLGYMWTAAVITMGLGGLTVINMVVVSIAKMAPRFAARFLLIESAVELSRWVCVTIAGAALAIIALIVTLVFYFLSRKVEIIYSDYSEIPGILCDNFKAKDSKGNLTGPEQYVYYYGAQALYPDELPEKALFHDDGTGAQTLPENRRNVMDLYGWALRGNRQWLCLYTTKDRHAGYPIKNGSLILDKKAANGLGVTMFGADRASAYNLTAFYNVSLKDKDGNFYPGMDNKGDWARYLHFTCDENAVYETDQRDTILQALIGSAISGGGFAIGGIGLVLGAVCGVVIGKKSKSKRGKDLPDGEADG